MVQHRQHGRGCMRKVAGKVGEEGQEAEAKGHVSTQAHGPSRQMSWRTWQPGQPCACGSHLHENGNGNSGVQRLWCAVRAARQAQLAAGIVRVVADGANPGGCPAASGEPAAGCHPSCCPHQSMRGCDDESPPAALPYSLFHQPPPVARPRSPTTRSRLPKKCATREEAGGALRHNNRQTNGSITRGVLLYNVIRENSAASAYGRVR